jgi:hypothetical protein
MFYHSYWTVPCKMEFFKHQIPVSLVNMLVRYRYLFLTAQCDNCFIKTEDVLTVQFFFLKWLEMEN